jgi:molecular chaperone GrpE
MGKQNKDALEDAMAEALASVERHEKQTKEPDVDQPDADGIEVVDEAEVVSTDDDSVKELHDRLLRLGADYDNFRKRSMRQMDEARRFGAEKVIYDLLAAIDNLERALAHAEGDESPMVEGVRMVTKQFLDVLGMHGVQGFDSKGEVFDPERHEAMGQEPAGERAPGTVVEEMLKGYFLHDRLLRPAQVIVAAAPAREDE